MSGAAALASVSAPRRVTRVVAVSGGKGGVGKTSVVVNMAASLAAAGEDVMILDGDLSLGNVNVLLGLPVGQTLADVSAGRATLDDITVHGPAGLRVIPGASGLWDDAAPGDHEVAALVHAFSTLNTAPDVLLVDSGAGLSLATLRLNAAAHEIVVVVCDEPASITDAYAYIKSMLRLHRQHRFQIVANRVDDEAHGRELFMRLAEVCDRFLNVSLDYLGAVPEDRALRESVRAQRALVDLYPRAPAACAFHEITDRMARQPFIPTPSGRIEFFVERLMRRESASLEIPA